MEGIGLLTLITFLPFFGAGLILLIREGSDNAERRVKFTALWVTVVTFALSLYLWREFDANNAGYQFVERYVWLKEYGISYYMGVDGISLFLIILNCFLMVICILASWESVTTRIREYMAAFLILQAFVNGVFCSLDLVMFYLFFEGMLIPMYLIIGMWGGENRVYAAYKFFLYTLLGSVLFLVAILYLHSEFGTTSIPDITDSAPLLTLEVQKWIWLAFFASFAVKVPMWPFHTWLPDAHVQAPTAGSVILAGILLKMGGYGFLRLSLPMLPDASMHYADFVFWLSVAAIIITSLIALVQEDMKKLIAYSSVAHMGFVTIGIFAFNMQGIHGAIFQMISHGLVSGALFLCVGVLYDRMHTKEIARYGGIVERMPIFAAVFMVFTMASVGLPGTSGFVGEFLSMLGIFKVSTLIAALSATGVVLGAAYMLWLYRRVVFGELVRDDLKNITDLNRREIIIMAPIVAIVILIGVYPKPILSYMEPSINLLINQIDEAKVRQESYIQYAAQDLEHILETGEINENKGAN
jgi:NADH-quinone oxidoreductase subunit M